MIQSVGLVLDFNVYLINKVLIVKTNFIKFPTRTHKFIRLFIKETPVLKVLKIFDTQIQNLIRLCKVNSINQH